MSESTETHSRNKSTLLLLAWALFSIPLIAFLLWSDLQKNFYEKRVQEGSLVTAKHLYADIIKKANNAECNTIYVEQGHPSVYFI